MSPAVPHSNGGNRKNAVTKPSYKPPVNIEHVLFRVIGPISQLCVRVSLLQVSVRYLTGHVLFRVIGHLSMILQIGEGLF